MRGEPDVTLTFSESWQGKVNPLVLSVCGITKSSRCVSGSCGGPRTMWALEWHPQPMGKVFFNGKPEDFIHREPRALHLYATGCRYGEDTREAELPARETYWVFTGGEAAGLERFVDNPERFARFRDPDELAGKLLLESVRRCDELGQDAFWTVQALFAQTLALLFASQRAAGFDYLLTSEAPPRSFSFEVEQYLRKNIAGRVGLADLAHYMKTSESLLSHKFKAESGVSPITRLIELRVERAKSLLLKGEKLKAIALATGHSSEYHLSRNFKTVTGLSPAEFRGGGKPLHGQASIG